jgi:hypothetical protein
VVGTAKVNAVLNLATFPCEVSGEADHCASASADFFSDRYQLSDTGRPGGEREYVLQLAIGRDREIFVAGDV